VTSNDVEVNELLRKCIYPVSHTDTKYTTEYA